MSEPLPGLGLFGPHTPVEPRSSAVVILYRRAHQGVEVFWVKRERALAFAGGFYAFPGGKLDADDAAVPVQGAQGDEAALRSAAARELFEEVGVLVAEGARAVSPEVLEAGRAALLAGTAKWSEWLAHHALSLRAEDLRPAGRWVTPPSVPVRFDTRFYLVELPEGAGASILPGELSEGAWIRPEDALSRWSDGSALLHPPAQHALQVLVEFTDEADARARLSTPPYCPGYVAQRIEFQRGVRVVALETPTLPPATHTNAYVLGTGDLLIVDPGSSDVKQYAKLLSLVAGLKAEGLRPVAVVLTHHHGDHVGGAFAVKERLGIPLWCHARTADRLDFPVERLLEDGEVLLLDGPVQQRWHVLHTPGHARGHVCLVDSRSKAAIVGDMVASVGSIVIDPPEGNMVDYLTQLKRLRDWPVTTLYPAHGAPVPDGPGKLNEYLRHRAQREALVLEAVPTTGATLAEVVATAYADTPPLLHPVAERSALASLEKLVSEGRVREDSFTWFRV
ncbi:MBL fold metallo-hydrolase [Corallococcus sp. Z5C101001]|uniref:MBL fold metallo-hydrolase n=1 Tax=Corallococcus sp. Z5C101001 TaxID=2596829 RepID=UPI00117D0F6B|nr:MBL fold metallo-hydrolase [Corallococcus sp. Z5C101001]TSC32454.1 MBL fold metallo-hydrolase [Corallococcus sp. Z5C101001]